MMRSTFASVRIASGPVRHKGSSLRRDESQMKQPAVSIVIPTHNRADMLRDALDSVQSQTFRDYEVIIVDDGSTEDVAAAVASHPTRPKVLRRPWRGPAAARNVGIREAEAHYIAFLDSDDIWLPQKLACFLEEKDAAPEFNIFYGPMLPIDSEGRPVDGRTKLCHSGRITRELFQSSFVHVPTVLCRRSLLLDLGGFDESLPVCEDYDLWLRMSLREPFGLIDQPLAKRRLHDDRLSKCSMSRNLAVKAEVLKRFHDSEDVNGTLDPDEAAQRLARVYFVAARAAFRNGEYPKALHFCRESRRYGSNPLRTIPIAIGATALNCFDRTPQQTVH